MRGASGQIGWLVVLLLAGCGGGGDALTVAPVSGTVTFDDKPLAEATVTFRPQNPQAGRLAPTSFGKTDAKGRYSLEITTSGQRGALIGKHIVVVTVREDEEQLDTPAKPAASANSDVVPAMKPASKRKIPFRYNRESELKFDVPPKGSNEANFSLKSDQTG